MKLGKDKAQLEFNLSRNVKDNKRAFYVYIGNQKKMHSLLNEMGDFLTQDVGKAARIPSPLHFSLY